MESRFTQFAEADLGLEDFYEFFEDDPELDDQLHD